MSNRLTKDKALSEAERLGIDVTGMKWPELSKTISAALREEAGKKLAGAEAEYVSIEEVNPPKVDEEYERESEKYAFLKLTMELESLKKQLDQMMGAAAQKSGEPAEEEAPAREKEFVRFKNGTAIITPEWDFGPVSLIKYDENLGEQWDTQEITHETLVQGASDFNGLTGTYKITRNTGKEVIAQATVPRSSAGIYFNPMNDMVPIVSWKGRIGYLYKHHMYPSVQRLLIKSGYYEDFKRFFNEANYPNNIWWADNLVVCDKNVADWVFRQIEHKASERGR